MRLLLILVSLFTLSARASDFSYADLVQLIQTNQLTRLEDVLPRMPESLRSGYTLVYESRSLQPASLAKPRVILFGATGTLTCAFNGDAAAKGYDTLECIQFLPDERRFDFRQIQFPSEANGLKQVMFSESGRSANGKISCSACHSGDLRPNWDGYKKWTGVYGSFDDTLDFAGGENDVDELGGYATFVHSRATDPRYKWLIQDTADVAPYEQNNSGMLNQRPNLRFINMVTRMNATRAARIMESKIPAWKTLAFAVSALPCYLTAEQADILKKAGFNPNTDFDLEKIFQELGLKRQEWTTQIFEDPPFFQEPDYDLQTGYGVFSRQVAMALIQQLARGTQDAVLLDGLSQIAISDREGYEGAFFQSLNQIVPDTQYSDTAAKLKLICPRTLDVFVKSYLGR